MEDMNKKLPYMPFYIGDWRKDPGVKALDLEHRGLWVDMLFVMWECEDRGKLIINGQVPDDETCGEMFGISEKKYKKMIEKILKFGVASVDEKTGCIYNRRMVNDEKLKVIRTECGKKGGNPALKKEVLVDVLLNQKDNQNPDIDNEVEVNGLSNNTPLNMENWKKEKERAFDYRWANYPGKLDGKKAAMRHWNASVKKPEDIVNYDLAIENYKQSVGNERTNGFKDLMWKNGSTWFNNWQDYIPVEKAPEVPEQPPEPPKPRERGDPKLEKLWDDCLEMVKSQIPPESYETWFPDTFPRSLENGTILVAAPNQRTRKALIENYRPSLELFLGEISGKTLIVDFCILKG